MAASIAQAGASQAASSTSLPPANPNTPNASNPPIAEMQGLTENTVPQNVRVGFSAKGLSGLDRDMLKKRALEESDPSSKVKVEDDFVNVEPPKKMGRLKGLGLGLLTGLAHGEPGNANNILGSAIGGGTLGAVKPHGVQEILRKDEIAQTDNDINKGLKQEGEVARLSVLQAKPQQDAAELAQKSQYDIERLNIERDKAAGLINDQEANRREREADRRSRKEIAAQNRESSEKIAGMPARARPASEQKPDTSGPQADAKYKKAEEYWAEATRKEQEAEKIATTYEKDGTTYVDEGASARQKALRDEVADLKQRTRKLQEEGDSLKAKARSAPTASGYSGRTMSKANLERYAKDKGLTVEAARAQVENQGVRVQ